MKVSSVPYLLALAALLIILIWLCETPTQAQQTERRFLLLPQYGQGYLWRWYDAEPYTILEEMCWDKEIGFQCDERMSERGRWRFDIVDMVNIRKGAIYENSYGCWLWWFLPEHDEHGNPHVQELWWIECIDEPI